MDLSGKYARYQVYVLRLWQEPGDTREHSATWRFVLEEPKTGQRRGFADFGALMDFLKTEIQMQEERWNPHINGSLI